jgi:hypothetical protein
MGLHIPISYCRKIWLGIPAAEHLHISYLMIYHKSCINIPQLFLRITKWKWWLASVIKMVGSKWKPYMRTLPNTDWDKSLNIRFVTCMKMLGTMINVQVQKFHLLVPQAKRMVWREYMIDFIRRRVSMYNDSSISMMLETHWNWGCNAG